jgi:hypothetical protein
MAASTVADPIANVLQRTFQNGSFGSNKNGLSNGNSSSSYGLIRGGSSSSVNSTSYLDSSIQAASKKTQIANASVQFDPPIRYVGNFGSIFKDQKSNGASGASPVRPKIIVLNPPKQGQVRKTP